MNLSKAESIGVGHGLFGRVLNFGNVTVGGNPGIR